MVSTRLYQPASQAQVQTELAGFSGATSFTTGSTPSTATATGGAGGGATRRRRVRVYQIRAGQLFDSINRTLVPNQVITVDRDAGVILDVSAQADGDHHRRSVPGILRAAYGEGADEEDDTDSRAEDPDVTEINLASLVLLPGFVDVHVHFFLHPYSETSWEDQLTKESLAERTVRAAVHARKTLMAGFTTVRDLGTEGAFDADIGLRKCLSGKDALIPGPRYYCSTRAIISSGSYGPRSSLYPAQEGIDGVKGAEPVDGVDECVKEVRKQIGAGADWIKIYADYPIRARMSPVSSSISTRSIGTFAKDELSAMITAAHARGVKVAAHANSPSVIHTLLDLDVDSVEHGGEMYDLSSGDRNLLKRMANANGTTTWVPTLAAYYTSSLGGSKFGEQRWERCKRTFEEAIRMHVHPAPLNTDANSDVETGATVPSGSEMENVACGGDTGVFAHGQNALEMVLMRRLGADWRRVLSWATYGGWKCVRGAEWEREEGAARMQAAERFEHLSRAKEAQEQGEESRRAELERGVPFGALRAGWAADLVGVEGTLDGTAEQFEDALMRGVGFVMKGGVVYKIGGVEVVGF